MIALSSGVPSSMTGPSTAKPAGKPSRKAAAKVPAKPAASGPRAETVKAAAEIVALRDKQGLAWSAVAERTGLSGSTLRRLYVLGGGAGKRAAK